MAEEKEQKPMTAPAFSEEEIKFIQDNVDQMSDEKIGEAIGRSGVAVKRWRTKNGLFRRGSNISSEAAAPVTIKKANINKSNISEEQKFELWRKHFRNTPRYKRIVKQFTKDDVDAFTDSWANYCCQFEDLKPSEEELLELMITTKLRIDDNRRSYLQLQLQEEELAREMASRPGGKLNLEEETADRFILEQINASNRLKIELNKDYKELNTKFEAYVRSLNATREQREQNEDIGGDTFFSLVRILTDEKRRKEVGRQNELMKMAIQKDSKKFKQEREFLNHEVDRIMLDGEDFIDKPKEPDNE